MDMNTRQTTRVERPVACAGKGRYVAIVHYGTPLGGLRRLVFEYSRKDPRQKGEAAVLRDITRAVPARFRGYIVAITIVKHCLHPKSPTVARHDRQTHVERVYTWVVEHESTRQQAPQTAKRQQLDKILEGHRVQTVDLPYTPYELQRLPLTDIVTTTYWPAAHASLELRGVERRVALRHLILASFLAV
jgi:hypothetical protein